MFFFKSLIFGTEYILILQLCYFLNLNPCLADFFYHMMLHMEVK